VFGFIPERLPSLRNQRLASPEFSPITREVGTTQGRPRQAGYKSRRESGYILSSPLGNPVDLHNLASRVVIPRLAHCAECAEEKKKHGTNGHEFQSLPAWHGWYGLRRGLATLATSLDSQLAAKSLLRHSNVQTTQQFYIKSVPADALRAVEKMDALFQKSANAVPN
jgi:hypothetical protein